MTDPGRPPPSPAPPSPRSTSLGTTAFALGLMSFLLCLGPLTGIPALVLGLSARRLDQDPARSTGEGVRGTMGAFLGGGNLILAALGALVLWLGTADPPALAAAPGPSSVAPALPPDPTPPPASPRARPGDESGQMSVTEAIFETVEGKITLVDLPPTTRPFEVELREQMQKAKAAGERLVLFVVSDTCRPCMSIAAVLPSPPMQNALGHARLVRVSINASRADLEAVGVPTQLIPGFYLLGHDLRPTDGITGGEWDDDTAENAAPVIGAFLHGSLAKRRHPFVPQPRRSLTPRAPTTLL
ncbi:MAG TPA: hypothetical protein VFS43_30625 [Polyangiaceae bacterium]|nr:hypothetical protein [Polyangiaceae bacterium]